ncbi:MAG: phosphoglycerate kinase [Candidatus Colwellbacteria bacterium]|nr:phosphoglycerate kinase [Candidatus Colwellbacteria bacterium]
MTAIVRVNLDVSDKEIAKSIRIIRAVDSLKTLQKKYSKIVILSHRGRPKGINQKLSLRPVGTALSKRLKKKVIFIDNHDLNKARSIIEKGDKGVYLLENVRFLEGEEKNESSLSKSLAGLGDIFINDDFATAHRQSSSVAGITSFIKSIPGPIMKAEVAALTKVMRNPKRPLVLIIGGAKVSDKMAVVKNLLPKCDSVLLGGGAGNTAMMASGIDIGDSLFDEAFLKEAGRLIKNKKVVYPVDFRVMGKNILDIGPNTERLYVDLIKKAGTIVWAGPLGNFEKKEFSRGSVAIAKAIASSRAFSVAGGGETTSLITGLGLEKKISFLSTGGSAMLDFLAGKKLPALKALGIK